jgi:hypothetical protein
MLRAQRGLAGGEANSTGTLHALAFQLKRHQEFPNRAVSQPRDGMVIEQILLEA